MSHHGGKNVFFVIYIKHETSRLQGWMVDMRKVALRDNLVFGGQRLKIYTCGLKDRRWVSHRKNGMF